MDKQKIISSKKVLAGGLFDVYEDTVSENNKVFKLLNAYSKRPVVSIIPITPKGEIFLIDQYRSMLKKRIIGVSSGTIEENETPLQAAKRELQEETGIIAEQFELLAKIELSRNGYQQTHFLFLAKDLQIGLQNLQEDEDIVVIRMPLMEAVQKVMNGEIYHSISMVAILLLDKLHLKKKR